jgi:hypothetical protein
VAGRQFWEVVNVSIRPNMARALFSYGSLGRSPETAAVTPCLKKSEPGVSQT